MLSTNENYFKMAATSSADSGEASGNMLNVSDFSQKVLRSLVVAIKSSNELCSGKDDYDFYSSFKGFCKVMKVEASVVRHLMSKIISRQGIKGGFNGMDLDEMLEAVIEANDTILEKVSTTIDIATGVKKEEQPILITAEVPRIISTSWNKRKSYEGNDSSTYRLLAARNVQRPQLKFRDKIDNGHGPFEPFISDKPNSKKPLSVLLEQTEYGEMYSHPYQFELDYFKPSEMHLNSADLQVPKLIEETELKFISTVDEVTELLSILEKQTEFAVDLEHHSYRTYQGITCLMQISTRDVDYIVDTLALRNDLQVLNEVFTNPEILKVFHGADKDIEWLQRDLGIYVVNMFDTGQASRVLSLTHFSLAFILKHYFAVDADKQFQLADWRIRPLPPEMTAYARNDTHYLLHIYDRMKNELLTKGNSTKNLLHSVFQRSKAVCERRYVKPVFRPDGYLELCKKSRKIFNTRQQYALRELFAWRDAIARKEDESIGYVLPNHMLLQIAEVLPRDMQGILACCNPIPTLVRQNLNELHKIILCAREQSLIKPVTQELQIQVAESRQEVDLENVLHCLHDFAHFKDTGPIDSGPSLLDLWAKYGDDFEKKIRDSENVTSSIKLKKTPLLSALAKTDNGEAKTAKKDRNNFKKVVAEFQAYKSPYERFKLVNPFLNKHASSAEAPDGTGKPPSNRNRVEEVKEHFDQLMEIHGADCKAPQNENSTSEAAASSEEPNNSKNDEVVSSSSKSAAKRKKPIRASLVKVSKKKLKKKKQETENTSESTSEVAPKKKKAKVEVDESNFQPFDYSKTDLKAFSGGKKNNKKGNSHYDPGKLSSEFRGKKKPKRGGGNKSLTYSTNKPKGHPKSQWPK